MADFEVCKDCTIHSDVVEDVKGKMENDEAHREVSMFFKAFSDPTRTKIINALLISEMCVCDLAALLSMNQSAISHQLKTLKQLRLVKYRRDGKVIYYSLDDDHIRGIFSSALDHVKE
ncbi:ArsR/SmtB family transcription factor [Clostridium sp.]|uniref:ArsR/SmtB family transcription factor n=1 Tax=Clostridium sp. TaxID=1506 RepID=UPI002FCC2025